MSENNESVFIELQGISPDDIPWGDEWKEGRHSDAGTDLSRDVRKLIDEEYPFEVEGVVTVVGLTTHERLNDAY